MFGSSFSPSWTYMVILFKNDEEGHKIQKFTLPSNQTEYANDNINAYRYFMQYLFEDLHYVILGVISFEDYIKPEHVGISLELAREFAFEREQKEEKKPHSFYNKEFFKLLDEDAEDIITTDQLREHISAKAIYPSERKGPAFNFTMDKSSAGDTILINFINPNEASEFILKIRKRYKEQGNICLGEIFHYLGVISKMDDLTYQWYNIEVMKIFSRSTADHNLIYSIMLPSDIVFETPWVEKK